MPRHPKPFGGACQAEIILFQGVVDDFPFQALQNLGEEQQSFGVAGNAVHHRFRAGAQPAAQDDLQRQHAQQRSVNSGAVVIFMSLAVK